MATTLRLPVTTEVGNYFVSNYPPYSQWRDEQVPGFEDAVGRTVHTGPLGLYVHVPFCRQRCTYCYFRVHTRPDRDLVDAYLDAVLREAGLYADRPAVADRPIVNAYFGGGTPTHLTTAQTDRLLHGLKDALRWGDVDELTWECQPGTFDAAKLQVLRDHGVTRASVGVQTFTDAALRTVGRAASAAEALEGFGLARRAGFAEVNIDLMAGLPGETDRSWEETIERVLGLAPDSVTIYQFELTHNSALYKLIRAGRPIELADWPTKRRWVKRAFEQMEAAGYTVYGAYWVVRDPDRHRFAYVADHYWQGRDLLALGESAFGLFDGFHYQNADTMDDYLEPLRVGRLPLSRAYRMSEQEDWRRRWILQMKTGRVRTAPFEARFGVNPTEQFAPTLDRLQDEGLLEWDRRGVRLTREGLVCVDWFLPRFYLPEHVDVRYT